MADRESEVLDEEQCLDLISPGGIGRIAYTSRYGPTVLPVNYSVRNGAIVFRTAANGPLDDDLRTGIADADTVDISNLQRQVIHFTRDLGKLKVESAAEKMRAINPDVRVRTHHEFLLAANIRPILADYDFVIDGTDNFAAKFLINDACVLERKPFSHGGILRFNGQTMTVIPGQSACYRCVFQAPPPRGSVPTCSQAGVLGAVAGMLGTIQAVEALKFIAGAGSLLTNTLLTFDAKSLDFRKVRFKRNPRCPICGENASIHTLIDEEQPVCALKTAAVSES